VWRGPTRHLQTDGRGRALVFLDRMNKLESGVSSEREVDAHDGCAARAAELNVDAEGHPSGDVVARSRGSTAAAVLSASGFPWFDGPAA
jgi:hypothetical protein